MVATPFRYPKTPPRSPEMPEFKIGDRVVLAHPDQWVAFYAKLAREGREAVIETADWPYCRIRFQTKRKVKYPSDYVLSVRVTDLAPAPTATET